jgi:hypothetical protein
MPKLSARPEMKKSLIAAILGTLCAGLLGELHSFGKNLSGQASADSVAGATSGTTAVNMLDDGLFQGEIEYYADKYGRENPDTIQIARVDFKRDGAPQYLLTFASGDWNGSNAIWGVVELKNGRWSEVQTLDTDGAIKDYSVLRFDPADASFVYLPSYKRNGLLVHRREYWTFTYLEKDVLDTAYFWTVSQTGLTNDTLKQLVDSKKLMLIRTQVP